MKFSTQMFHKSHRYYSISLFFQQLIYMSIVSPIPVTMVKHNDISKRTAPAGKSHHPISRSHDGRPLGGTNITSLMVFFFLKDKDLILEWGSRFLPEERKLAAEVWQEVDQEIGNYVRGKMWEILIVWGASYITFVWLNLPFALLLSLFVGLSVLVPYIGATVMFIPVGLIAFFEWGWGGRFAYIMIALGIIQALDGNLLVPLLLSGVVNIHPIAIIVAVLVFGGLWGMWGLFFAIPLATLFHAVIKAWRKSSQKAGSL